MHLSPRPRLILLLVVFTLLTACGESPLATRSGEGSPVPIIEEPDLQHIDPPEVRKMLESSLRQIETTTDYTQEYFPLPYPNGDVPAHTGACTDVVIRAMRNAGVDLQREVHEDMRANFKAYPAKWGLKVPDPNIDHRRVPNLQTFFERRGKAIPVSADAQNYRPGDIVSWDLNGRGMTHIGIVSNQKSSASGRYLIVHNIGQGARLEDRLFDWKVTGHYRYF